MSPQVRPGDMIPTAQKLPTQRASGSAARRCLVCCPVLFLQDRDVTPSRIVVWAGMKDGLCNKPRLVYKVRTLETGSLRYFVDFSWGADRHSHPPAAVIPLTSSLPTQHRRRQRSPKKMSIWDFADLIAAGALTHGLKQLNDTSPLSHLTWGIFARWKRCDAPRPPACTVCTVRLECENC